jgi:hypothetical protein
VSTGSGLAHFAEHPELAVAVTSGTEHWSYGQTTLTVHGSGAVEVDNRRSGRHQRYTGRLDPDDLAAFCDEMAGLGLTTLSSTRTTYEMGEATVTIELRDGDAVLHHADLPADDRFANDGLDRLVRAYDALVSRVTDGALPYGPLMAE